MFVTPHARKRIVEGDEKGLRTILSPEAIVEILTTSSRLVDIGGGRQLFFSPADKQCLIAVVDGDPKSRSAVLVTLMPGDQASYLARLRAEFRVRGAAAIEESEGPPVRSYAKADAGLISIIRKAPTQSGFGKVLEEVPVCNCLDFRFGLFAHRPFLLILADILKRHLEGRFQGPDEYYRLEFRGVGWRFEEPPETVYELLGEPNRTPGS